MTAQLPPHLTVYTNTAPASEPLPPRLSNQSFVSHSFARTAASRTRGPATIAPGQPLPPQRQRDKFVPLPDEEEDEDALAVAASAEMPLIEDQQPSRPPSFEQVGAIGCCNLLGAALLSGHCYCRPRPATVAARRVF